MNDSDFEIWLKGQQAGLDAFGKYVVAQIVERVKDQLGEDRIKTFFKIQPFHRAKEIPSAVKKKNKKKYSDPTYQMTDLVGARFVVLLRSDINIVESVLINCDSLWTARRDREPKLESDKTPDAFRYQSVHYIVRNIAEITIDGVAIPAETACEIQIRTLLQHAYAELGHDRIYKGDEIVPPSVHRIVARSMALMETTDHLFCEAVEELERINKDLVRWCDWLDHAYQAVGAPALNSHDDADASRIIETFHDLLLTADTAQVLECFNKFAVSSVKSRSGTDDLFGRPVVILVYWLVKTHPMVMAASWPLPKFRGELEAIAADLGISFS
jgi:ppGpp synthetase/RelA/SpoT-type nucleotidyltranferase